MSARLAAPALLLATCAWAAGCASPEYVIEDSEQPLFLGYGNLLTARKGSQEVNVRRIRDEGISFRQTWLDPLSPDVRSLHFDPGQGQLMSVGALPEGEHPLRSGSPRQRQAVREQLGAADRAFSLRSWPEGEVLATRSTWPGLARSPDGKLLLRASREARFELYSTASGTVVAYGPPSKPSEARDAEDSVGPPPRLSGACFTGPDTFAYAWKGEVFLGRLEGAKCSSERFSAGDALAYREGRLYVLVKNRFLRAFELETRRPLWQSEEVSALALSDASSESGWPWKLRLTPDGGALAVEASEAFLVANTRQGQLLLGPYANPAGFPWRSLSLGNGRCAAIYFSGDSRESERQIAQAYDYGPKQQETLVFELEGDADDPLSGLSLSVDGLWLGVTVGAEVQVWRLP
jgi:hypothetical protein